MRRKTLVFLFALFLVMWGATGCGSSNTKGSDNAQQGQSSGDKIYIGWVSPLTGVCADAGEQLQNGAKLAVKEVNDAGGIDGKQIELVFEDDKSDPKEAANIATKFASDDRLVAILGNYNSSCLLASGPIYNEAKLPVFHNATSAAVREQHGPYLFRIAVTDGFQGKLVTDWLFDLGYKKPAIIYEDDDYGRGMMGTVTDEVKAKGGTVTASETYLLNGSKDFTGILTKIKATNPDALYIGGMYNEGALIAKQMETVGLDLPIFASDALYEQSYINLAGTAAEGTRVCGIFLPTSTDPKVQAFIKAYKAAYGEEKTPGTYAALFYDAAHVFMQAIKEVGPDKEKIRDYIAKMPPYTGVTGQFTIDDQNDTIRAGMNKIICKDGKWQAAE